MPSKTQSILLGGLVVAVLSTSVLGLINFLCCAGVIIGAMTGVWHYTSTHNLTISAGQGVLIGVLAAVMGAVIAGILNYLLTLAGLDVTSELMMRFSESMGAPPEALEQARQQQGAQSMGAVLLGIGVNVIASAIFGAIGGAIGASVFKRGGDTPGGGSGPSGGGSGGPREPAGGRPRSSGGPGNLQEERTAPTTEEETRESSYRPERREGEPQQTPRREEETAPREG